MSRNALFILLGLAAAAGLTFGLLGTDLFPSGPGEADRAGGAGGERAAIDLGPGARGDAEDRASPVLFGRARESLIGKGGLVAQVARVEDGAPVAGARILLAGTGYGGETVALRARTGEDGRFRLAEVAAGDEFVLRIEPEGVAGRAIPSVSVADGAVTNLGTLWLGEKSAVEGRVVDGAGDGVEGAEVRVLLGQFSYVELFTNFAEALSNLDREPEPLATATSDQEGRFRFEALDPGPVTLVARAAGFQIAVQPHTVTGEARPGAEGEAGAAQPRLLIRLAGAGVLAGRVVGPGGGGLADCRLAVVGEGDPGSFLYGRVFTRTDRDGRFRVDTVPLEGSALLIVAHREYPSAFRRVEIGDQALEVALRRGVHLDVLVLHGDRAEPAEGVQVFLAITEGEAGELGADPEGFVTGVTDRVGRLSVETVPGSIQMAMLSHPDLGGGMWAGGAMGGVLGTIEGPSDPVLRPGRREVTFRIVGGQTVAGRVTGPDGAPIAGARVTSLSMFQGGRPTATGADGRYRLVAPRPGPQVPPTVVVLAEGFIQDPESMAVASEPDEHGVLVHDVSLRPSPVVTGRVVGPEGRPVPGARVKIGGGGSGMGTYLPFLAREGLAGRDGRYVVDGVAPGEGVRVLARAEGFVDSATEPFEVAGGGAVSRAPDLVLQRGATLVVQVEGPDRRPLAGAVVSMSEQGGDQLAFDWMEAMQATPGRRTPASGDVRFENVRPGKVTFTARHPEHAAARLEVEVPRHVATPAPATLVLSRSVAVAGRVLDADGRPVPGAKVEATGTNDVQASATTDGEGRFQVKGVPQGPVRVQVYAARFRPANLATEGPVEDLEVRLRRPDAGSEVRLAEITARLGEIGGAMREADAEERQRLGAEMQALVEEMQALRSGAEAPPAVSGPSSPGEGAAGCG